MVMKRRRVKAPKLGSVYKDKRGRRFLVVEEKNGWFDASDGTRLVHRVFLYLPIPKGESARTYGRTWQGGPFLVAFSERQPWS